MLAEGQNLLGIFNWTIDVPYQFCEGPHSVLAEKLRLSATVGRVRCGGRPESSLGSFGPFDVFGPVDQLIGNAGVVLLNSIFGEV